MIYVASAISFMFGFVIAGLLAFDSDRNKFEEQYIKGKNEGYRNGYADCYRCLMGESTIWSGDNFED